MAEKSERRRWERASVAGGSAICRGDGQIGGYSIVDASMGGVCLGQGAPLPPGTDLEMALWWVGFGLTTVRGTVVRADSDRMAVAFVQVGREAKELLSELARSEKKESALPLSLVFCPMTSSTGTVRDLLAAMGQQSLSVSTPLQAIVELQRRDFEVREVFAEDSPSGRDFLGFVRDEYPQISRVLLTAPEANEPTFADDDLVDRVVHLWVSPADQHALRRLGIGSDSPPNFADGTVRRPRIPESLLFARDDTKL